MIFGRNPAVFYALIASLLQLLSGLGLDLSLEQQGALNAAIAVIGGAVVAWRVAAEKGIALLSGVAKAVIAVALAFGVHLSPELQGSVMSIVTVAVAFYLRTQVVAPEPPETPAIAEPGPIENRFGG